MSSEWVSAAAAIGYVARVWNLLRDEAGDELVRACKAGRVRTADQEGDAVTLSQDEWLEVGGRHSSGDDYAGIFFAIRFRLVDIEAEFQPLGAMKAEAPPPAAPPKRKRGGGGPAPQYEWDRIVSEVIRRVWEKGLPRKIAPLAADIFEWCEHEFGAGNSPDINTLRLRITAWLAAVRQEGN